MAVTLGPFYLLPLGCVGVGRSTWLCAACFLLTVTMRTSGGNLSPCVKQISERGRGWHRGCWKPFTTVITFSCRLQLHPAAEIDVCVVTIGSSAVALRARSWHFVGRKPMLSCVRSPRGTQGVKGTKPQA